MTFKVKVATIFKQYCKSHRALNRKTPFPGSFKAFETLYEKEYNIKIDRVYLIFQSEAHYTWFLLRWT